MKKSFCPECKRQFEPEISLCPYDGTNLTDLPEDIKEGEIYANRYRITGKISSGGAQTIFKADDTRARARVAIKIVSKNISRKWKSLNHLEERVKTISTLSHKNIIKLIDFGEDVGGRYYLVTPYIEGRSIEELIKEKGAFSVERFSDIADQILDGAIYAQEMGLMMQNLGCGKIMVTLQEQKPVVKIIGFEPFEPDDSKQGKKETSDAIYSLGVIFYRMLTSDVPFVSESMWRFLYQESDETPEPLGKTNSDIPEKVESFVMKCLEKDLEKRFSSFPEIRNALAEVRQGGELAEEETVDIPPSEILEIAKNEGMEDNSTGSGGKGAYLLITMSIAGGFLFLYLIGGGKPKEIVETNVEEIIQTNPESRADEPVASVSAKQPETLARTAKTPKPSSDLFSDDGESEKFVAEERLIDVEEPHPEEVEEFLGLDETPGETTEESVGLDETQDEAKDEPVETTHVDQSQPAEEKPAEENLPPPEEEGLDDRGEQEKIEKLLASARVDLDLFNLTTPPGANAFDKYKEILQIDPDNKEAQDGIDKIVDIYMTMARRAAKERRWNRAKIYLDRVDDLIPESAISKSVRAEVMKLKEESER